MADRWKDRLERIDRAVDRAMSEAIRIVPMRVSDFRGATADPDRTAVTVAAVLTMGHGGDTDLGGSAQEIRASRVRTASAEVQITRSQLPAGYEIRKGDHVEAIDHGLTFVVERVDREHRGRLPLHLSILSGVTA